MNAQDPERTILHIIVVGFHHQRGSEVEFLYPPLAKHGSSQSTATLPSEWRFLPFLALPDGAHNCEQDTTVFHLPSLSTADSKQKLQSTVFGISCYRQIESKDLKIKNEDVTRSTVQKSVCVLSCLPLYGYLKEKLQVATRVYFEEKDFSRTGILEELYKNLNMSVSPSLILEESLLFVGLSVVELIKTFRHRILVIFKLLLLERKVIFHGFPVDSLCSQLLSLVSLFPKMIQSGLVYAVPSGNGICQQDKSENDIFHPLHVHECEELSVDIFGFPLAMFTKNSIFHPYLSLQQMELLKSPHVRSFVVGASNYLYKRQKGLSDVLVDLESGAIEIHDPELNEQLSLSTADLRFADYLIHHVNDYTEKGEQEAGWDGSDEWIRAQFKLYLLSLLSTIQHTGGDGMANYNEQFIEAWKQTTNYQVWRGKEHAGIDDVHAGHPFQGQMGLSDIKIRLSNVMHTERGRRIGHAVAETGKAVGGAINSARSFMTSLLSELTQSTSEESEETGNDKQPDEKNAATTNQGNNVELKD